MKGNPRELSILMTLYWLKAASLVTRDAFSKKTVARRLRSLRRQVADPAHARLLPSENTLSWLLRHNKKIDKQFAAFSSNGYAWLTREGIEAIDRLVLTGAVGLEPQKNCPECGAPLAGRALNGWQAYYKCGYVGGFAVTGYVPVYFCADQGTIASLASADKPRRGMPVRFALRYCPSDGVMAQDVPPMGRIVEIAGSVSMVELEGRFGDTRKLIPSALLVEAGKPDTTALSDNQLHVLSRLSNGSAVISQRSDGRPTVKSVPNHRLGHITCMPETWEALRLSGALEEFLRRGADAA